MGDRRRSVSFTALGLGLTMTDDLKFPVKLCLTEAEGLELYRLLTDERPMLARLASPLQVSPNTIVRLHVALRERSVRNRL